ncbi:unnamed protein product [Vicia faba]|uniref:Uncharacterized protein n=1 Tax=Vicia faba TaxID=3906 RepID=A0AAV1AAB0_VICFA|nr:unnamed protein product [Vicia faba]
MKDYRRIVECDEDEGGFVMNDEDAEESFFSMFWKMKMKVESEYWERKKREILASFLLIPLKRMKNPLDKSAWYLAAGLVFAADLGLEAAGFLFLIFCFHRYTGISSDIPDLFLVLLS